MVESVVPKVYVDLASQLVNGSIDPNEFMIRFLGEFKAEKRFFDNRAGTALNELFYATEEFVDHPSSRPEAVDEVQLRAAARDFLQFVRAQAK